MRRTIPLLLTAALLALAGCAAAPSADGTPTPAESAPPRTVAFSGDSYTAGVGASDPAHRWSTLVSAEHGWSEINLGIPGLGFVTNREASRRDLTAETIAQNPDIVIVALGLNDVYSFDTSAAEIRTRIADDLDRLRDGLPDARLVVIEPFWWSAQRPEALEAVIGWVREAAEAADADYVADASRWIQDDPDLLAADGAHPNDAGHALIARRMDEALADLGL